MIMKKDLKGVVVGDTYTLPIEFQNEDGLALDITGWTVTFKIKKNPGDSDADAEIDKDITTHTSPTEGKTKVELTASETDELTPGKLYYILQVTKADGQVKTYLKGRFPVERD